MSENVKNFIDSVQNKDYTAAKDIFQGAMAEKISAAFENKKIELASQMTEGTQISEGAYDVPWDDELNRDIKKWERKYNVKIKPSKRDADEASVSGKDSDIKKFLSKELDFDEMGFEMMGLTEGTQISETKKHSHDFNLDMFGGLDAKLSRGDTVDLKGLEVDDMNTSSYKKYMDKEFGGAVKNLKTKVDRTGMANLSFEVADPKKTKSVLQDHGLMD